LLILLLCTYIRSDTAEVVHQRLHCDQVPVYFREDIDLKLFFYELFKLREVVRHWHLLIDLVLKPQQCKTGIDLRDASNSVQAIFCDPVYAIFGSGLVVYCGS
jgi:hypothetical protein